MYTMETCKGVCGEGPGRQGPAPGWVLSRGAGPMAEYLVNFYQGGREMAKAIPGNSAASLVLLRRVDGWPFLWWRRSLLV